MLQRDLARDLRRHHDYPHVLEEFAEGLGKTVEDPVRFVGGGGIFVV